MLRSSWGRAAHDAAQFLGQGGPDHHQVGVALVVGEVDALLGLGRAAVPARLRPGQQPHQAQQEQAHRLGKHAGDHKRHG
jgi:hypothetical protein